MKFCCATGSPVCPRTHLSVYLINTVYLWSVIDFIIEPWMCLFRSCVYTVVYVLQTLVQFVLLKVFVFLII